MASACAVLAGFVGGAAGATAAAQDTELQLDLRGTDLAAAIDKVAEAAGVQVFYTSQLVEGRSAAPLAGKYSLRQAMDALLRSTGLEYRILADGSLVLRPTTQHASRTSDSVDTSARRAPTNSTQSGQHSTIAHVIVNGRKRAAALMRTPDSISVITGEWLERQQANDLADAYREVPGLFVRDRGPYSRSFFMRGVQNDLDTGAGPVGVYVDDLPLSASGRVDMHLFDVDRIEVLRGPQGTLYGAGAMTGAVRYVLNQPQFDSFEARVAANLSVTQRGGWNHVLDGMLNLPLDKDRMALRLVAYAREDSGFVQHRFPGLSVPPDPGLPAGFFYPGSPPVRGHGAIELPAIDRRRSNVHRVQGGRMALAFAPEDNLLLRFTAFSEHGRVEDAQSHQPLKSGDLRNGSDVLLPIEDRIDGLSLSLERGFERYDLYATASLSDNVLATTEPFAGFFPGGLTPPGTELLSQARTRLVTTEFRLASKNLQRAAWLAGVFYSDSNLRTHQWIRMQHDHSNLTVDDISPRSERQVAAFGEFSWRFTPTLSATVGMRLFSVEKIVEPSIHNVDPAAPIFPPRGRGGREWRFDDTVDNYRFNIAWESAVGLLYLQAAQGFRVGGVNTNPTSNPLVPPTYGSDDLWSYELGAKRSFADGRWDLDAALYYLDWSKVQTRVFVNGAGFTLNAGSAHVVGLELAVSGRPWPGLEWALALSVLDGRLDDAEPDGNFPTGAEGQAGDRLPGVPQLMGTLSARYDLSSSGGRQWFVRGGVSYSGSSHAEFRGPQAEKLGGYALLDLGFGYDAGPWSVELFARNALDRRVELSFTNFTVSQVVTPNRPRTVGLSVDRRF